MGDYNNDQMGFYDSGYGYTDQQQYDQQQQHQQQQQQAYGYDAGWGNQNYSQNYTTAAPTVMSPQYGYNDSAAKPGGNTYGNFDDEPPLLEELGINFDHIILKTKAALNPFEVPDPSIMDDTDLAGPLVFCVAFGAFLLLCGKVYGFGYIYGVGALGCASMYAMLNLMSMTGVNFYCVVSILGYCLLPMVLLSGISVLFALTGSLGTLVTGAVIIWCSLSASKLFVTVLAMDHQQPLVAYPCALLYGVFALLTVF